MLIAIDERDTFGDYVRNIYKIVSIGEPENIRKLSSSGNWQVRLEVEPKAGTSRTQERTQYFNKKVEATGFIADLLRQHPK